MAEPFTILRDVPQTMRDGTVLRADVYRPSGGGPFPALLERTPYGKDSSPECQVGAPPFFASRGYAVVVQDVRGRFASEGRFVPFQDDGWGPTRDGYDTVEWIATQPWCTGAVGTIGGSYAGATQYRLAPATEFQESETLEFPGVAVRVGAVVGPLAQPLFCAVGVAQAMPWRLNALKIAVMCGVPSFRLPLSSSAASHCM